MPRQALQADTNETDRDSVDNPSSAGTITAAATIRSQADGPMRLLSHPRFRLGACLLWCLAWPGIALLLLTPLPFRLIARSDLLGHFLLFAVMTVAIVSFARSRLQIILLSVISIGYGVALEFAQAHVPNRTFDLADMVANGLGGIVGCGAALLLLECFITPALGAADARARDL